MRTRMAELEGGGEGGGVAALMVDEGAKKQRRDIEKKMNVHVQQISSTQEQVSRGQRGRERGEESSGGRSRGWEGEGRSQWRRQEQGRLGLKVQKAKASEVTEAGGGGG